MCRHVAFLVQYEIMDAAWFEIIRRHPEVQVDSDGKTVTLERNHNLRNELKFSSVWTQGSDIVSSVVMDEDYIITVNLSDELKILRASDGGEAAKFGLRESNPPAPNNIPPSTLLPATHCKIVTSHLSNRVVILTCDLFVETITPETIAAAKKASAGKKDAPVLSELVAQTNMRSRLIIVDVKSTDDGLQVAKARDWYLSHSDHIAWQSFDVSKALDEDIQLQLADDGRVLSCIQRLPASDLCTIFDLPAHSGDAQEIGAPACMLAQWRTTEGLRLLDLKLKPPSSSSSADTAQSQEERAKDLAQRLQVLVAPTNACCVSALQLVVKTVEVDTGKNAKKPPAPAKGAAAVVDPYASLLVPQCSVREGLRVACSAPVTAIARMGRDRVVLGQRDGLVRLCDNLSGNSSSSSSVALAQHPHMSGEATEARAISCLLVFPLHSTDQIATSSGDDNDARNEANAKDNGTGKDAESCREPVSIVAGAFDGSLSLSSNVLCSSPMHPIELCDFRHDLSRDPVLTLHPLRNPSSSSSSPRCFVADYASGKQVLYAIHKRSLLLLGSICLKERTANSLLHAQLLNTRSVPQLFFEPDASLLRVEVPAEEARGGGGAKKSKAELAEEEVQRQRMKQEAEEARKEAQRQRLRDFKLRPAPASLGCAQRECLRLLSRGVSLRSLCAALCVSRQGAMVCSAARDDRNALYLFDLNASARSALKTAASSNTPSTAEPLSQKSLHPNANPLNSSSSAANVLNPGSSRAGVRGGARLRASLPTSSSAPSSSAQQLKLTEARLHLHEKQLQLTRDALHLQRGDEVEGEVELWTPLPRPTPPLHPRREAQTELLRNKRDNARNKQPLSKRLSTLATLCS